MVNVLTVDVGPAVMLPSALTTQVRMECVGVTETHIYQVHTED